MSVKEEYKNKGFFGRLGFGKKIGVLVIDLQKGFTNPNTPPGADLTDVIHETNRILDKAREKAIPVMYAAIAYENDKEAGLWLKKAPLITMFKFGSGYEEIDERLNRRKDEPIFYKHFGSAFFGTPLASYLVSESIDTLIVTGISTSGCVRATAIDALQNGFRAILPKEAIGDRAEDPHKANLFDIDAKYGDVIPVDEVLEYLDDYNG